MRFGQIRNPNSICRMTYNLLTTGRCLNYTLRTRQISLVYRLGEAHGSGDRGTSFRIETKTRLSAMNCGTEFLRAAILFTFRWRKDTVSFRTPGSDLSQEDQPRTDSLEDRKGCVGAASRRSPDESKGCTIGGIKDQLVGLQQWHWRVRKKTLSITEDCRGLRPSIDTCDLTMRDKAGSHYLHFSETIDILPRCFNHAKHVFPYE
jgi:hypothetical protein